MTKTKKKLRLLNALLYVYNGMELGRDKTRLGEIVRAQMAAHRKQQPPTRSTSELMRAVENINLDNLEKQQRLDFEKYTEGIR